MSESVPPELVQIIGNASAADELVAIGQTYWHMNGIDPVTRRPIWAVATSEIDFEAWSSSAYIAAAAGVTATGAGYECSSCGGPLTLISRQALQDAIAGARPKCRACNSSIEKQVAKLLGPTALANAEQRRIRVAAQQQAASERQRSDEAGHKRALELASLRKLAIANRYSLEDDDIDDLVAGASLSARVGALSIVVGARHEDGLLRGIDVHNGSIGPTPEWTNDDLLGDARAAGLIRVHPSSPEKAFVFEGAEIGSRWIPSRAHFCAGGTGSLLERWNLLVEALRPSLDLGSLDQEVDDVIELARRTIAEEVVRYLTFRFEEHNLTDPMQDHAEHVRLIADRGSARFSIGHLYTAGWMAARDAATSYQKNTYQSKADAVTYGVRQFERLLQKFLDGDFELREPFSENKTNLPLSAVTNVVFATILGLSPMTSSLDDVERVMAPLRRMAQACVHAFPERHEMIEVIRTHMSAIDPDRFRQSLALLEDEPPARCGDSCRLQGVTRVARDLGRFYDRIVSRVSSHDAVVITAEASDLANTVWDNPGDSALALSLKFTLPGAFEMS